MFHFTLNKSTQAGSVRCRHHRHCLSVQIHRRRARVLHKDTEQPTRHRQPGRQAKKKTRIQSIVLWNRVTHTLTSIKRGRRRIIRRRWRRMGPSTSQIYIHLIHQQPTEKPVLIHTNLPKHTYKYSGTPIPPPWLFCTPKHSLH